jgi:hypothetical protein
MGTKTQKQRKCCYHNLNAKQLTPVKNAVIVGKSLKNLYPPEPIFVNVDARWIEIVMPQLIS